MKIQFDRHGATALRPDFHLLRAALFGVQAGSPTGRAAAAAPCADDRPNALIDLFAAPFAGHPDDCGSASFNIAIARRDAGGER